jgi:hypothetical protein
MASGSRLGGLNSIEASWRDPLELDKPTATTAEEPNTQGGNHREPMADTLLLDSLSRAETCAREQELASDSPHLRRQRDRRTRNGIAAVAAERNASTSAAGIEHAAGPAVGLAVGLAPAVALGCFARLRQGKSSAA